MHNAALQTQTVSRTTVLSYSYLLPLSRGLGQLLMERICSPRSKFFPFKVDPISEELFVSKKVRRKSGKLFLFEKVAGNMAMYTYTVNLVKDYCSFGSTYQDMCSLQCSLSLFLSLCLSLFSLSVSLSLLSLSQKERE